MADGLATTPNAFQRLMLQWERLAPYNAGQYATLAAEIDVDAAMRAWRNTSIALGLQQIGQHPDSPVTRLESSIEPYVTDELNRDVGDGASPLRPFVAKTSGGIHIGLMYRHVVADSASIRQVMRAWIESVLGRTTVRHGHVSLMGRRDTAQRRMGGGNDWSMLREATAEFSRASRAKRVRRLPASADVSSPVRWRRVALPAGTVARLLTYARRHGVKVNDLFVAAAAIACDRYMPDEDVAVRSDLGIGTIADVRPTDRPAHAYFGLSLGFLQTFWRWQDLRAWPFTLAVAAAQSRVARERGLAAASGLRLWTAVRFGESLDDRGLANFYRKRCPLAAGVSNVNLNRDWPTRHFPDPMVAYTRISPLGPMLPLVFTPTTLGDTLHMGVTYRTNLVDEARCDAIIGSVLERLALLD